MNTTGVGGMNITGVGSRYTYLYDARTNRLMTKDGKEDVFVRYFNGESSEDEKGQLNGFHAKMKSDIESMIRMFGSGIQGVNIFQKEDEPFEISAEFVDGEETRYTVNDKHSFTGYAAVPYTRAEIADFKRNTSISGVQANKHVVPDEMHQKALKRYELWLGQSLADRSSDMEDVETLLAEKTSYTRKMKDGSRQSYITFYEKNKIRCIREDKAGYDWELPLEDESQYDRVMLFLAEFRDKDNLPFTCHKNFWNDFLSGELDEKGFKNFLSTTVEKGGKTGFQITEDGIDLDRETAKYWAYMDPPEFVDTIFRTTEEFRDWLASEAKRAQEEWGKTHLSWVEQFNQEHPNLAGKKSHYWRGVWYTAEEIDALWQEQVSRLFTQTQEDALRS